MAEAAMAADQTTDDGLLAVADLVRMFEDSEEATQTSREQSERDRDYVDNKQLTAAELATLKKRGQPPTIINRIKRKIDYLVGVEKTQRVDPRALPRTPKHEQDADGATEGLRYVADTEDYDSKRSGVWRNMLVEGAGGIGVSVEPSKYSKPQNTQQMMASTAITPPTEYDIKIYRVAWDRMFADPHSCEADYSDAGYLGVVIWEDAADAKRRYKDNPEAIDILETTLNKTTIGDTYDDKPKYNVWADKKRKRVRIVQIWIKKDDEWHFAEFTKGGILKAGPSPYKTDKGESDCELIFQSAYVNRDNERYGIVREMISPQDEINKRRSKALHLLNTHQTTYEEGSIPDIEAYRKEKAKPDGTMVVSPGALSGERGAKVISETRTDLADGHFKLLQESKNEIDLMGPNGTQMGDKTGGSNAASGKAILASQQGGMIEMGDLLDNLRHLDKRVYRAVWNRIRQYWTAEKWIRVTDDERNVKWVGLNVDPQQVQMAMQQNPEMAQKIGGVVGSVAELDCDIIIDEAPDSITPALEQFQALVELKKYDVENEMSFRSIVKAAPNLRNKDQIFAEMDKAAEARQPKVQQTEQIQLAGAVAEVKETESRATLNLAKAGEAQQPEPGQAPQQQDFEIPPEIQVHKALADIDYVNANTDNKRVMTALAPAKAHHDAQISEAQLKQRAQQQRQPARV